MEKQFLLYKNNDLIATFTTEFDNNLISAKYIKNDISYDEKILQEILKLIVNEIYGIYRNDYKPLREDISYKYGLKFKEYTISSYYKNEIDILLREKKDINILYLNDFCNMFYELKEDIKVFDRKYVSYVIENIKNKNKETITEIINRPFLIRKIDEINEGPTVEEEMLLKILEFALTDISNFKLYNKEIVNIISDYPLSPLTSNEEEWELIENKTNVFRNKRCKCIEKRKIDNRFIAYDTKNKFIMDKDDKPHSIIQKEIQLPYDYSKNKRRKMVTDTNDDFSIELL